MVRAVLLAVAAAAVAAIEPNARFQSVLSAASESAAARGALHYSFIIGAPGAADAPPFPKGSPQYDNTKKEFEAWVDAAHKYTALAKERPLTSSDSVLYWGYWNGFKDLLPKVDGFFSSGDKAITATNKYLEALVGGVKTLFKAGADGRLGECLLHSKPETPVNDNKPMIAHAKALGAAIEAVKVAGEALLKAAAKVNTVVDCSAPSLAKRDASAPYPAPFKYAQTCYAEPGWGGAAAGLAKTLAALAAQLQTHSEDRCEGAKVLAKDGDVREKQLAASVGATMDVAYVTALGLRACTQFRLASDCTAAAMQADYEVQTAKSVAVLDAWLRYLQIRRLDMPQKSDDKAPFAASVAASVAKMDTDWTKQVADYVAWSDEANAGLAAAAADFAKPVATKAAKCPLKASTS